MSKTSYDEAEMRVLPLLRKARSVPHFRDNLLTHLIGTWSLLTAWGAPAAIRNAGLIHSVYSTSFFNHALFTIGQRRELQRLIGQEAEALAFLFCVLDRAFLWARIMELREIPNRLTVARHDGQNSLRLSKKVVRDILMIECANLADQAAGADGGPAPWMTRVAFWLELIDLKLPGLASATAGLTETAEMKAIVKYSAALNMPAQRAIDALSQAVALNPFAAEPRILRALCAIELGDTLRELVDATRGQALLTAWSTPWDKRLNLATWREITSAIIAEAVVERRRRPKFPVFAAVRRAILRPTGSLPDTEERVTSQSARTRRAVCGEQAS